MIQTSVGIFSKSRTGHSTRAAITKATAIMKATELTKTSEGTEGD